MAEDPIVRSTGPAARTEQRIGKQHPSPRPAKPTRGGRRRTGADARRRGNLSPLRRVIAHVFGRIPAPRRERPVRLALPRIETAADVAAMLEAITTSVRRGSITPDEGAALAQIADTYIRAIETREFDRRLRALEAANAAKS